MRHGDEQKGIPFCEYNDSKANIEALAGVSEGCIAYATDTNELGTYDGSAWQWANLGSVSGDIWVEKAGDTMTGQLYINGGSDEIQLKIDADASQSDNIIEIRKSNGSVIAAVQSYGAFYSHKGDGYGYNLFLGRGAGENNAENGIGGGEGNTFVGGAAGAANTSGYWNNGIGLDALLRNTVGYDNNAMGADALAYNTEGHNNNAMGSRSLVCNTLGDFNCAVGSESLYNNTTGDNNVGIGGRAGYSNETGSANVFIGYNAGYNETGSNKLYISNSDTSSPLVYGEFDTPVLKTFAGMVINEGGGDNDTRIEGDTDANLFYVDAGNDRIGIGTTNPSGKLIVKGAGTTTGIGFQTQNSSGTAKVTILDNGKVGIGTSTPSALFTLEGVVGSDIFRVLHSGASSTAIRMIMSTTWADATQGAIFSLYNGADAEVIRLDAISNKNSWINAGGFGIGTTSPTDKLHVVGQVLATSGFHVGVDSTNNLLDDSSNGSSHGGLYYGNCSIDMSCPSDERVKNIIEKAQPVLQNLLNWRVVNYTFKKEIFKDDDDSVHVGLIAQDVENGTKDVVMERTDGWKGIQSNKLVPYLVSAIQEQQEIIEKLNTDIEYLKSELIKG